ncbi:hypothetical protein [Pseudomonas saliphila]|uniref:hypothetical protein n=1 Tax=Pseudomonas saliphila TaxID=2586906 RepID=UPI0038B58836
MTMHTNTQLISATIDPEVPGSLARAYSAASCNIHYTVGTHNLESYMAKPNYSFEKRQRELKKSKQQEEKRQEKLARKAAGDNEAESAAGGPAAGDPAADSPAAGAESTADDTGKSE